MSLDPGDQATIIGVGVAVLLGVGGATFKAATLRGDMNSKWTRRVSFAVAALDEKEISELRELRAHIDEILPGPHEFDPTQAIADPAPLSRRAEKAIRYYRVRTRMEGALVWLRRIGPVLVGALAAVGLCTAGVTAHYGELVDWRWLRLTSLIGLGVAGAIVVLASTAWVVLQHRLAGGEILAGTGGRALEGE